MYAICWVMSDAQGNWRMHSFMWRLIPDMKVFWILIGVTNGNLNSLNIAQIVGSNNKIAFR